MTPLARDSAPWERLSTPTARRIIAQSRAAASHDRAHIPLSAEASRRALRRTHLRCPLRATCCTSPAVPGLLLVERRLVTPSRGSPCISRAAPVGSPMSGGYIPLFSSLTTGTLCGRWPDVGLWPIVLSLSDRHGVVDVTPMYLASVTGLPIPDVVACMRRFCEADPYSRTDIENGSRLVLIDQHRDWGWRIVNHGKYREKARKAAYDIERTASGADAERKRTSRENQRSPDASRAVPLSDSDSDSDSNSKNKKAVSPSKSKPAAFHAEVVAAYHRLCPALPQVKGWPQHRKAALEARIRERCTDGKPADTVAYWEEFFASVAASDFLCGRTKDPFSGTCIDWLLGPKNFLKVIEKNYSNRGATGGARTYG
jgi:hypothetical protein